MKYFALDSSHIVEGYVTITSELNEEKNKFYLRKWDSIDITEI